MSQYAILTQIGEGDDRQEASPYPLAKPNNKTAHAFQKLRLRCAGLSDQVRYQIAVREGFDDWVTGKADEDPLSGGEYPIKEPDLSEKEYIDKAASVLFPAAPVAGNEDYINREVFLEAESDFLPRIERPQKSSSRSSADLSSLIQIIKSINPNLRSKAPTENTETT